MLAAMKASGGDNVLFLHRVYLGLLFGSSLDKVAQITHREIDWKVHTGQHLGEKDIPACYAGCKT